MLRLRGAREFQDEKNKQSMEIDEEETTVKVERSTPDEDVLVGPEGFTPRNVEEREQITDAQKMVRSEQDVVQAQQTPFFISTRSHVAEIPDDTAENVESFDSGTAMYQSQALTQDPNLSKSIDLESTDDPVKLRRAALRNMALTGFPLHRSSNLALAEQRPSSSNLPPPPDLPFYSKPKRMSPARRALIKDMMEEGRRTLHYDPI